MSNQTAVLEEMTESRRTRRRFLPDLRSRATTSCPPGFAISSEAAWTQFESLPMPARKDQAWRFSNVNALDLSPYNIGATVAEADAPRNSRTLDSASKKSPAG